MSILQTPTFPFLCSALKFSELSVFLRDANAVSAKSATAGQTLRTQLDPSTIIPKNQSCRKHPLLQYARQWVQTTGMRTGCAYA